MTIDFVVCAVCAHLDLKNEINGKLICKAYPNGIPQEVLEEKHKPGAEEKTCQNGYKFEHFNNDMKGNTDNDA